MSAAPLLILYVEDNEILRETIGMLLEADGREITMVSSAEEALVAAAATDFDLVVSDVSLPGLSGTELARRLLAQRPECSIVLCSGHDLGNVAATLGPRVHTLAKPFEIDVLEAIIGNAGSASGRSAA